MFDSMTVLYFSIYNRFSFCFTNQEKQNAYDVNLIESLPESRGKGGK